MLHKSLLRCTLLAALALLSPAAVHAAELEPVTLEPMRHADASLTVVASDGQTVTYTPDDLERFPTYRLVTTTPWREQPAAFEGVLLRDVLAASGLDTLDAINVVAENDYAAVVERTVWETTPVLVATRVDGKAHSRRARGPIQFIIDMDDYRANDLVLAERHMVWMAARIEPLE